MLVRGMAWRGPVICDDEVSLLPPPLRIHTAAQNFSKEVAPMPLSTKTAKRTVVAKQDRGEQSFLSYNTNAAPQPMCDPVR